MNVTPLVDVVLVLLIIFMVIVPQLEAGASITPPSVRNPDAMDATAESASVLLTKNGDVILERVPLAAGALGGELVALHKRDPHRTLRIKADRETPYGMVREVYRTAQVAGFPAAGLEVGEIKADDERDAEAGN
jgi:biopolymer transport protein TolR